MIIFRRIQRIYIRYLRVESNDFWANLDYSHLWDIDMIDLCIANSPKKLDNSGIVYLGISTHSPIMTIKTCYGRVGTQRTIDTHILKYNTTTIHKNCATTVGIN